MCVWVLIEPLALFSAVLWLTFVVLCRVSPFTYNHIYIQLCSYWRSVFLPTSLCRSFYCLPYKSFSCVLLRLRLLCLFPFQHKLTGFARRFATHRLLSEPYTPIRCTRHFLLLLRLCLSPAYASKRPLVFLYLPFIHCLNFVFVLPAFVYHSASICRTSRHISQLHASRLRPLLPSAVSGALR